MPAPARIVSLLPSATEIVWALGLGPRLVGVSHECDYPAEVARLPRVTRTVIPAGLTSTAIDAGVRDHLQSHQALYSVDVPLLRSLAPDLLVSQALCDVCAVAGDDLAAIIPELPGPPVLVNLEPMDLAGVMTAIRHVGDMAGASAAGRALAAAMERRMQEVVQRVERARGPRPRVAFLEWIEPLFNGGHWTPELIRMAGGEDVFDGGGQASRTRSFAELQALEPDVLFVACCGFDAARAARDLPALAGLPGWDQLRCVRSGRVFVADGSQYFNRPGPRLADSLAILAAALHPQLDIPLHGAEPARRWLPSIPGLG